MLRRPPVPCSACCRRCASAKRRTGRKRRPELGCIVLLPQGVPALVVRRSLLLTGKAASVVRT